MELRRQKSVEPMLFVIQDDNDVVLLQDDKKSYLSRARVTDAKDLEILAGTRSCSCDSPHLSPYHALDGL